ncbi:MAG: DUF11 domain-containing protein [Patulibacter sp.]|nr:DUF11 domain-containing protein [Patulibacter sp.]
MSALLLASFLLGASKAKAAPGDPFDPLTPYVFVGQNVPTGLFRAVAGPGGSVTFSPEGAPSAVTYNAIGYNTTDDYIYGVVNDGAGSAATPTGSIVRIGEDGVVTRVGTSTLPAVALWGAMDGGNNLYVGLPNNPEFRVIDTQTGAVVSTGTLSMPIDVVDMTYAYGYFWGVTSTTGDLVRMDLESAAAVKPVDVFPLGLPTGGHGAAWTFGNGNLGFSHNSTGRVTQLAVTNPGSASPTATVVATSTGPASNNNDGAASPGAPTDLSIVKDAPTSYDAGDSFTYTVTVTNDGPGLSTGSVVTDLVPTGLSNVQTSTPGCIEENNQVTCTVGELAAGASQTITITVDSPASAAACFTNAASVLANEVDPDPSNNDASVTSCPRALSVTKTSDATAATQIGDTVTYTVTATNTGLGDYTLAEPAMVIDDLSQLLDDAIYNADASSTVTGLLDYTEPRLSWTGALDGGDSVELTYSVTTHEGGDGTMRNVAFQPDVPGGPTPACAPPVGGVDPVTGQPCAQVVNNLPSLTIVKTADRASVAAVGETITYSYLITNTGATILAPATVTETAFSGTGGTPTPVCPAAASSLAPGDSVTCAATYVTTQADVNAGAIVNTAVGTGTPPGGPPVESPPSTVRIETPGPPPVIPPIVPPAPPAVPRYDLQMTKTATRRRITVGDTIAYRLFVKNVGPDAADGVRVTDEAPNHLDVRSATTPQGACTVRGNDVDCAIGKLDGGQSLTVTVRATALRSGTSSNTANVVPPPLPPGVPPIDPPANNVSTARVRIVKPKLRVRKTVDRRSLRAGQVARYTIRVTNPSRRSVRNVRTCDRLPSGMTLVSSRPTSKVSRGQHCWTAKRLAARKSVTYRIAVRAHNGTSGRKTNVVQARSPDARSGRAKRSVRIVSTAVRAGGVTG